MANGVAIAGLGLSLDVFDRVRGKLLADKDPAAEKLCAVFDQLRAMYSAIDTELSAMIGMVFWEDMDKRDFALRYGDLSRLTPETLRARFAETRAHCTAIQNIYQRFLKRWFERVLDKEEQDALRVLFEALGDIDGGFVFALDDIAGWLGGEAQNLKWQLEQGDFRALEEAHKQARDKGNRLRDQISIIWRKLADLRAEFVGLTGAVDVGSPP